MHKLPLPVPTPVLLLVCMPVLLFVVTFLVARACLSSTAAAPSVEPIEPPLAPIGSCLRPGLSEADRDTCVVFTNQCNRVCWGMESTLAAADWRESGQRCVCAANGEVDVFTEHFTRHERVTEAEAEPDERYARNCHRRCELRDGGRAAAIDPGGEWCICTHPDGVTVYSDRFDTRTPVLCIDPE